MMLYDLQLLGFVFNQFLYGEVTGIQVGHWLYDAPDLDAARFLARQSLEEMQHVDNFLQILRTLRCAPAPAHRAVRFLSTGMMGGSWAEHVALEMAQGEGFVLMAMYALIDTLDHGEIVSILRRAVKQEERHVAFGERRTMQALRDDPAAKRRLQGLALVSMLGVEQIAKSMHRLVPLDHEVMRHLPSFLRATLVASERRLLRMGLFDRPLAEIGYLERARLIATAYGYKALDFWTPRLRRQKRLTDTYLVDPIVVASQREPPAEAVAVAEPPVHTVH